ncbi:ATP-binding cassette domain-containing protein [Hoyosella subflava]|uniref:Nickel import system ATP-binding protein NikD n=1 Tax=Hoyosella subflava (strain DSM 45089 / JCM 17490 / NBRC 109087 / DQS3-9A1) TaxID=443218 RepID=F6EHA0_HOYSD|nr:ABC transporter ATP-binding protein [Hoyosella subflava]AEF41079.1 Putative ABC transporter ATP-binding protein [Hoyosella subflava DQS3-9A1]
MTLTDVSVQVESGLIVQDLTVRIPLSRNTTVHAATGVSLNVASGRITGLAGESGCGKSVVASAVMRMLPRHAVVSGNVMVRIHGEAVDVLTGTRAHRGRHVALVPQSPSTHFTPVRTIRSQLDETIATLESPYGIEELAQRVGLPTELLDSYPHELSGGLVQRAAIAAALAGEPAVIVADEPTASLDRRRTDQVLDLLRECADAGAAVLLITHDLGALLRKDVADTLAIMYASRIVEVGPARDVLADPWHEYTSALLAALPERGLKPLPRVTPALTDLPPDVCAYTGAPTTLVTRGDRTLRERSI